jgi:hypothetical protein
MKFAFAFSCFVACCVSSASAESIATLTGAEGPVLVNTGEGYSAVDAKSPTALKIGDSVLVKEQGFATLSFAECAVTLDKPTVLTITEAPPCTGKNALPTQASVITPVVDDAAAVDPLLPVVKAGIVGGMVIGTGIVLVTGLTDDNESDPISPP